MAEKILIVADDADTLRVPLEERGFEVETCPDASDGYRRLTESLFDLVIISLDKPITGATLVRRIKSDSKLSRLIVLTVAEWGSGQPTMALSQGADAFEPKPTNPVRLVTAVEKLLHPKMVMAAQTTDN